MLACFSIKLNSFVAIWIVWNPLCQTNGPFLTLIDSLPDDLHGDHLKKVMRDMLNHYCFLWQAVVEPVQI